MSEIFENGGMEEYAEAIKAKIDDRTVTQEELEAYRAYYFRQNPNAPGNDDVVHYKDGFAFFTKRERLV